MQEYVLRNKLPCSNSVSISYKTSQTTANSYCLYIYFIQCNITDNIRQTVPEYCF